MIDVIDYDDAAADDQWLLTFSDYFNTINKLLNINGELIIHG